MFTRVNSVRFCGFSRKFCDFFRKKLQKNLQVIKKYLPLQSQTKRTGTCRSSSVGRAQPCQGWGREFEPRLLLQKKQVSSNADFRFEKESAEMLT